LFARSEANRFQIVGCRKTHLPSIALTAHCRCRNAADTPTRQALVA